MGRDRRLTEAYERARVVYFGGDSKYVFMSDCHRGDGSLSDEFNRNENAYLHAMAHYFHNGFTYVEVGDGDELWEHPQYKLIKRAHAGCFEAMKRFNDDGRCILLWGNHNNYLRDEAYVEEHLYTRYDLQTQSTRDLLEGVIVCEALRLTDRDTGQEFFVAHGHQGDFANDQAWPVAMFMLRHFWRHLHAFGAQSPSSPARNARKRDSIERDYHAWVSAHKTPLICGHTHLSSFPRDGEVPYFNAGCCVYPSYITALEIEEGQILLARWTIVANDAGILQVERQVIRGPEALRRFDMR